MKTFTLATAAALLSTSYAATVNLETTACAGPNFTPEQFNIDLNPAKPVAKNLQSVCGLRIRSASDNIDVNTIKCQAFKDAAGTQAGSAVFTFAQPARISTNPVQEQAILCTYPTNSTSSVVQSTVTSFVTASTGIPAPSSNLTLPSTTLQPSVSQTSEPPKQTTGAASHVGVGMGVVAAAIAAMLV